MISAASAGRASPHRTAALNASCPCVCTAGEHLLLAESGQHESGFIWPDTTCGSLREKEIPSCFQGQLEVLSSSGMVQGELNLDVISGIWPEISSSVQEIVCLCLSKQFWLSLLKSLI